MRLKAKTAEPGDLGESKKRDALLLLAPMAILRLWPLQPRWEVSLPATLLEISSLKLVSSCVPGIWCLSWVSLIHHLLKARALVLTIAGT